ncbi:MAG: PAS domain S-box protein, partial [Candidatus Cloacimonetes bacterium]|nr:PAS domain S-box protein [Candidatus Cloacimonadota bacterium]
MRLFHAPITGFNVLDIAKKKCPEIPFIIVTDSLNEETAIKCIRWGAWDYVIKDKLVYLGHAVKNAIKLKVEKERIKQAEEALRESEEKFRAISESAIDSIFIKDVNSKYIHVNPAMEKLFGLTASNLIGKTDIELFGEEIGKHIIETDKKVIKGEIFIDKRDKTVRGELHSFHVIKVPLKNSEGKIIGLCGIARDITEKKQAKELLRESEQKFRDMANLLPQIVYEIDIYGNLIFVNKQAFESFGYSQEEYEKGINVMQTLITKDKDRAKKNMQNILYGKNVENPEYTALRKDGNTFPILIYSSAILKDNKPVGLRGIIVDITERKQAE